MKLLKHKLSDSLSFGIEPYKERLRLIVFDGKEEFVCRKENQKNLNAFLSGSNDHLFKGRLQLVKSKDIVNIQVKGKCIGSIPVQNFLRILGKLQAPIKVCH